MAVHVGNQINCGCVCMSGDQRLPQMCVGDQWWPQMCPVLWTLVVANINYVFKHSSLKTRVSIGISLKDTFVVSVAPSYLIRIKTKKSFILKEFNVLFERTILYIKLSLQNYQNHLNQHIQLSTNFTFTM